MAEVLRYDPKTGDCTNCHKEQKTVVTQKSSSISAGKSNQSFQSWQKSNSSPNGKKK